MFKEDRYWSTCQGNYSKILEDTCQEQILLDTGEAARYVQRKGGYNPEPIYILYSKYSQRPHYICVQATVLVKTV